jgi:predicted anti-sigma-YlaC factor YlaD
MAEIVTPYMERAISFRARVEVWTHLWRCEACRRYYDQVRRTVELLGNHLIEPPPRGTEESLLAAAHERRRLGP